MEVDRKTTALGLVLDDRLRGKIVEGYCELGRLSSPRMTETPLRRESGHLSRNLTLDLVRHDAKHITSIAIANLTLV
jgi:hypothetical protein